MNLKTTLDIDLVAVETADEVAVLLDLSAPPTRQGARQPQTVQIVLDRSGSMAGERLEAAKDALEALIARLDPTDAFGLVVFDDAVQVAVPTAPLTDKPAAVAAVRAVGPGGMTNLSGGFLAGCRRRGGRRTDAAPRCCCSATGTRTSGSWSTTSCRPSLPPGGASA